ncbi:MAG: alpha/beta fold hydrolase [Dehalococcoidia bacterium]
MDTKTVSIRNGMFTTSYLTGGRGRPLVFLHGAYGNAPLPLFDLLAENFTVYAPWHPGWGAESPDDLDHLDDVIDLALYYQDFFDALGLDRPVLVGHSFGGMVAAETAALCSPCLSRLVLIAPIGLWRDEAPIPDIFTMSPKDLVPLVFNDPESPIAQQMLTPPDSQEEMAKRMLERAQALAATGKFIWPIPDKGLKKRIHRVKTPTLILWGETDKLAPPVYAQDFHEKIAGSQLVMLPDASHMVMVEQGPPVAEEIARFAREE